MAQHYGPKVVTDGLVLSLDAANPKSYSPNVYPYPLDLYSWITGGYQQTISRETGFTSPAGGKPLKIVTSGTSSYTSSYNNTSWNFSTAANGDTWTVSFWVKGSSNFQARIILFQADSAGNYLDAPTQSYNVSTEWRRVELTRTFNNASTTHLQLRWDIYVTGVTMWVDGVQVEKNSSATNFNKIYNQNGATWSDLSGNGYNFTLSSASAYVANGGNGAQYMDLETYGAKYLPGGVLTDIPWSHRNTFIILSEIKSPDSDWKTLMRSANGDHQVIINSGDGISLGMYDNDGGNWQDSGFDVNSMPNYDSQFNFMAWHLSYTNDPYYRFYYNSNLSSPSATLSSSSAQQYNRGYASVGGYHNANSTPTSFSQEFGKIAIFLHYNKFLSTAELEQNFQALKGRFGL